MARLIEVARWSRSFHRWIAYGGGVIVALWVVTGIVMIFPAPPATRAQPAAVIDPAAALRTPSEAAQALPANHAPVRSVTLRDLGGRLVYDILLQNARHVFVDATTARRIEFSDSLALALARRVMLDSSVALNVTRLTTFDRRYRMGMLPAYRVELHDRAGTLIHVAADGSSNATSGRSRWRGVMGNLHVFQLPGVSLPARPRKLLLVATSVLTVVLVVTGYVLALPRRWRP